jgi:DNA alkylation damage repair protein AlkB
MIHRDLSVPHHQTNMHLHYNLPYREAHEKDHSFFSYDPDSGDVFVPKDPSVHKPLTMDRVMNKRLHWVTLGGQYDWTNRVYPGEAPPAFPPDLAAFLEGLFPETLAQAAIVNFYTPGDTMMMHRDVSEETDRGLVSISLGCEGLFMITPRDPGKAGEQQDPAEGEMGGTKKPYLLLKLRSGDAVYMTGEARFAWHGVPKVLKGTCPSWLEDWPAEDGKYEAWRGWMRNKRVNLNVRQMRE